MDFCEGSLNKPKILLCLSPDNILLYVLLCVLSHILNNTSYDDCTVTPSSSTSYKINFSTIFQHTKQCLAFFSFFAVGMYVCVKVFVVHIPKY